MNAKELLAKMTLEEKASLCSGKDFWHLKGVERLGLPEIMVTDGPHGLRKQAMKADHLGINDSVPSTCFPTASATASTFNRSLMHEIGIALGEECQQEDVAVILGPGVNIKRSPLCGRNFEYISEDPLVAGEMAAALIGGIQSQGVGTSMKHYAMNNQEARRMSTDSVVDERAQREIYLPAFETAVKKAQPWTIMCSYNKVDGTYASDNKRLMTDILRDEWGFEGALVTDWGAMNDRVKAVVAGLDLEMPASGGKNDAYIVEAVQNGTLKEADLDTVVLRIIELILKYQANHKADFKYDLDAHHALARRAAAESCVLLKNEGNILPVQAEKSLAVIGAFAKKPRYQGAGSSKINPTKMDCAFDSLTERGVAFDYAEGYSLEKGAKPDETLVAQACEAAKGKDCVLLFAGLPDEYESEGFDRTTLDMPAAHNQLIEAVCAVNPNTVVVLLLGAPVVMPWAEKAAGVLVAYLGGQAGGSGCVDVLLGDVCPSGRLAESWPEQLDDMASTKYFPGYAKSVEYRESIFVGYRWLDSANMPVAWPFGYGLSYTQFAYSDLTLSTQSFAAGDNMTATFTVTNTGNVAGAEVAQLYVGMANSAIARATHELRGFEKVHLLPGESKTITILLSDRAFSYYNVPEKAWAMEGGEYTIQVGANSRDIKLSAPLQVQGDGKEALLQGLEKSAPEYFSLKPGVFEASDAAFVSLLGRPLPPRDRMPGEPFTINSTFGDIKDTFIGKQMLKIVKKQAGEMFGGDENADMQSMADAMMMDIPLRTVGMLAGDAMPPFMVEGLAAMANGKYIKGIGFMLKKKK